MNHHIPVVLLFRYMSKCLLIDVKSYVVQISEVEVVGKMEEMTAKDALLLWAQKVTEGSVVA